MKRLYFLLLFCSLFFLNRIVYSCNISNYTVKNTAGYGIAYPTFGKEAVVIKDNLYKDNAKDNVFTYSY